MSEYSRSAYHLLVIETGAGRYDSSLGVIVVDGYIIDEKFSTVVSRNVAGRYNDANGSIRLEFVVCQRRYRCRLIHHGRNALNTDRTIAHAVEQGHRPVN